MSKLDDLKLKIKVDYKDRFKIIIIDNDNLLIIDNFDNSEFFTFSILKNEPTSGFITTNSSICVLQFIQNYFNKISNAK